MQGGKEDLGQDIDLFANEEGLAETEVILYYGEKYYEELEDDPDLTCIYSFTANHPLSTGELESEELIMPNVKKSKVKILEFEDALFNLNSALLMPIGAKEQATASDDQEKVNGIAMLATIFKHLEKEKKFGDKKILVMGHTDSSGDNDYNAKLSKMRSLAVVYLLLGDNSAIEKWVDQFKSEINDGIRVYQDDDIKMILTWVDEHFGWGCNPDGKQGRTLSWCIKRFKVKYNNVFSPSEKMDPNRDSTKKKFWQAIFVLYQYNLGKLLAPQGAAMPSESEFLANGYTTTWMSTIRSYLQWAKNDSSDESAIGCGESWPVDDDNHYSQTNRRAEILFFDTEELPLVTLDDCCIDNCGKDECPIYGKDRIEKTYLWKITNLEIKISVEDDTDPSAINYKVYLNDGNIREGYFDNNGYAVEKDVPIGEHYIYVNAEGYVIT